MSGRRTKYDEEFKKNTVNLSYASPRSIKQLSKDLGIGENLLYRWRQKYTADGEKANYSTLEEEKKLANGEYTNGQKDNEIVSKIWIHTSRRTLPYKNRFSTRWRYLKLIREHDP